MNLILFREEELDASGRLHLSREDRRTKHILSALGVKVGDRLRVGQLNGRIGHGRMLELEDGGVLLEIILERESPLPWFDLLLAVPRPKALQRLWADLAAVGVGHVYLTNAARVQKCYFASHALAEETREARFIEGLEQSCTTLMPEVSVHWSLEKLLSGQIAESYKESEKYLAHPHVQKACAPVIARRTASRPLVAIGPEGGWLPDELDLFVRAGFKPITLGERVLRSGTACVAIAGALSGVFLGSFEAERGAYQA